MPTSIGDRIVRLRQARDLNQAGLARLAGVPATTLSQWEAGKARLPAEALPRLAEALGVSYEELLGQSAARPQPRDTAIADRVRDRLLAEWDELPEQEQAAIDAIAEDLQRWRAVLLRQEHQEGVHA